MAYNDIGTTGIASPPKTVFSSLTGLNQHLANLEDLMGITSRLEKTEGQPRPQISKPQMLIEVIEDMTKRLAQLVDVASGL